MAKELRVGVIGLGWPGTEHLKNYKRLSGVTVTALCDLQKGLLAERATEHDVPRTYTSYKRMLTGADVDAVSIAVPNDLHAPMALAALKAGKHVLCEKPPAMTAAQATQMAAAAKKGGCTLMYALCQRFSGESLALKAYIDAGDLGEIQFARAVYHRRRGIPLGTKGWFVNKRRSGGGVLIDNGVHALDRSWWLMGNPKPVSVTASTYANFTHTVPQGIKCDVEDSAYTMYKFANGATLIVEVTWARNLPGGSSLEVAGTQGGATDNPLTIYTERHGQVIDIRPEVPEADRFAGEVTHFIDCIRRKRTPGPSADNGIWLMKMLQGAYQSAKTGKEVRLR
jgi:predicted dehydrogenase